MPITPFMNLDLPTPTVTLGPEYAEQNNGAFETIDSHNHTSGQGNPIPIGGLQIDESLDFEGYKIYDLLSIQFDDQNAALSGAGHANSVYSVNGNLYFTNGSGTAVQITTGGSVVSVPSSTNTLEFTSLASNLTIDPSDTFVIISVDTSVSRTIDLPLASAVAEGRFFIIKDATGESNDNPITLARQGSDTIDGETSQTLSSNYGAWMVSGNGVSSWLIL